MCAQVCMRVSVHVCACVCTRGVHTWCVACTPPTCWGPTAGCCPCFGGQFLHQSADVASEVDSGLGPAKRGHLWRGRSSVLRVFLVSYHRGAAAFAHKSETPELFSLHPAPMLERHRTAHRVSKPFVLMNRMIYSSPLRGFIGYQICISLDGHSSGQKSVVHFFSFFPELVGWN